MSFRTLFVCVGFGADCPPSLEGNCRMETQDLEGTVINLAKAANASQITFPQMTEPLMAFSPTHP